MNEERYLTVQEAAEALGVSRATIWRLTRGEKPMLASTEDPMDKRARMISRSAINELLRQSAQYARRAAQKGRAIGPKALQVA